MLSWCHPGSDYPFNPSGAMDAVQVSGVIPFSGYWLFPMGICLHILSSITGDIPKRYYFPASTGMTGVSSLAPRSIQQLRWRRFPSFPALWNQVELYTLPVRCFRIFSCVVKSIHGVHVMCQVPN
jgi:hypothetical protein